MPQSRTSSPKPRWRALFFAAPAGAWLMVFTVPGPCTVFDGVGPPRAATDGEANDADGAGEAEPVDAGAAPDCGLTFVFGPTSADGCAELATDCCQLIEICAEQAEAGGCRDWVECANRCPVPRMPACVGRCGTTPATLADLAACFYKLVDGSSACYWPFEDAGKD